MKTSIHQISQLIIVVALLCIKNNAHAVGASTPFVSYEAESGQLGGGASIVSLTSPPTTEFSSPQLEASGHAYVHLGGTGQYVQLTNNTGQAISALNIRYSIPDSSGGGGISNTIDLYVAGTYRGQISVDSYQTWVYETSSSYNGMSQTPSSGNAHVFWDEVAFFVPGGVIPAGATFVIQQDSRNTATYYNIDVVDLETPPASLSQPANSLSITSYGAVSNNPSFDNTSALQNCINAAESQSKSVWIPPGTFYVNPGSAFQVSGITIQGAGPWYSEILDVSTAWANGFVFNASSTSFENFCIDATKPNSTPGEDAFTASGNNWTINNIWARHLMLTWGTGNNITVENSRVNNSWGDGININNDSGTSCVGVTISNNFVRGCGDDAIAINSSDASAPQMANCTVVNNTTVASWWADQLACYGGDNLIFSNNLLCDCVKDNGIHIDTYSSGSPLNDVMVENNVVLRGGSYGYGVDQPALKLIGSQTETNITIYDNTIENSMFESVEIGSVSNLVFQQNLIEYPGTTGIQIDSGTSGSAAIFNNIVQNVPSGYQPYVNYSSSFAAAVDGNSWQETMLIDPTISAFSSYYNTPPYVRNVTNLVENNFVSGEPGLSGPGYDTDTHDNGQDDVWHHASGDTNPYVIFDLGANYNLFATRYWNLNQSGSTQNGAKDVRISISGDGATYTIIGTNTLAQGTGTTNEPAQDFATPTSVVRYVKIEPLDGYGGGWNGLGAVRFVVKPVTPVINSFSSYYDAPPYVRNVTNLVQNYFVSGEQGLSGPGFSTDTHDNQQDDVWHHAASDSSPYVTFDLGRSCNLSVTRIWNLNQAGYTVNGASNVLVSVSTDGTSFTALEAITLDEGTGTTNEPSQSFSTPATGIRYVKLQPLDGYGGGWNGLGAVRFQ
jgi:hypothetical protein